VDLAAFFFPLRKRGVVASEGWYPSGGYGAFIFDFVCRLFARECSALNICRVSGGDLYIGTVVKGESLVPQPLLALVLALALDGMVQSDIRGNGLVGDFLCW
jgi:hypothetical protein